MLAFRTIILLGLTVTLASVVAACGPQAARTGASSAESHAPGTTLATTPGPCSAYSPGTPGVVRTFCGGPATLKAFVAGKEYDLSGGECATDADGFSVNLGVISTDELGGPKPDYFGLTLPAGGGHFTNAPMTLNVGGKAYALSTNTGDFTPTGGTFTGAAAGSSAPVTGSFSC